MASAFFKKAILGLGLTGIIVFLALACYALMFHHRIYFLPYKIREPGTYHVMRDISIQKGNGITVYAHNVTLNLNEHTLDGSKAPPESDFYAVSVQHKNNFKVFNGTIQGFKKGIQILASTKQTQIVQSDSNHTYLIEDLTFIGNTARAITVKGKGAIIRRNRIQETRGPARAFGIDVQGPSCLIENNVVSETESTQVEEGVGIALSHHNAGCVVKNNLIYHSRPLQKGRTFGIWVGGEHTSASLIRNFITNASIGIASSGTVDSVYAKDNIVKGAYNSFIGCRNWQNGGGNRAILSKYDFNDCYAYYPLMPFKE